MCMRAHHHPTPPTHPDALDAKEQLYGRGNLELGGEQAVVGGKHASPLVDPLVQLSALRSRLHPRTDATTKLVRTFEKVTLALILRTFTHTCLPNSIIIQNPHVEPTGDPMPRQTKTAR